MAVEEIENLLNCFEGNLNVILNCVKKQKSQYLKSSNRCKCLKSSLNDVSVKVKKVYSLYDDLARDYDSLLQNSPLQQFLNFLTRQLPSTATLQIKDTTTECNCAQLSPNDLKREIPIELKSENYETTLQDNFTKEIIDCDYPEKDSLELQLQEANEKFTRLKAELEAANAQLMKTNELLKAEIMLRSKVERERDSLTCSAEKLRRVFLKYENLLSSADKIEVFGASNDAKSTTESDTKSEFHSELELNPLSPPIIIKDEITDEIDHVDIPSSNIKNFILSFQESLLSNNELASSHSPSSPKTDTSVEEVIFDLSPSSPETDTSEDATPTFECDLCGKSFMEKTNLEEHILHHMKGQSPVRIKENIVQFSTKRLYNTRSGRNNGTLEDDSQSVQSTADSNNSPWYQKNFLPYCKVCKRYFSNIGNFNMHKRNVHLKVKPYKCIESCGQSFGRKYHLHRHQRRAHGGIKTHLDRNGPRYQDPRLCCNICKRYFRFESSLIKHIAATHDELKRFAHKCGTCGKVFDRKSRLEEHETMHTYQRPFQCSTCMQTYKSNKALSKHRSTAHGSLRFCCANCDKTFAWKCALISHIAQHHLPELKEDLYECPTCGKSFVHKSRLSMHQTIHITERSKKCAIDTTVSKIVAYNQWVLLQRDEEDEEQRTHEEGFRFNCAHCDKGFCSKEGLSNHVKRVHL